MKSNPVQTTGFRWEASGPCPEALAAFVRVTDDNKEFPHSYSGQAWRAAYRLWKAIDGDIAKLPSDPYAYDVSWNWGGEKGGEDLGLSGFMAGWAINAVRQMLKQPAIGNPAIVTLGVGNEPCPAVGPAEGEMQIAIGGKTQ